MASLRIEKGYGSWGRDYSPEYWPHESGLAHLIRDDKPFLNRDAWEAVRPVPPRYRLVTPRINSDETDASGCEPVFLPDEPPAGQVNSGAYGWFTGMSLALAWLCRAGSCAGREGAGRAARQTT